MIWPWLCHFLLLSFLTEIQPTGLLAPSSCPFMYVCMYVFIYLLFCMKSFLAIFFIGTFLICFSSQCHLSDFLLITLSKKTCAHSYTPPFISICFLSQLVTYGNYLIITNTFSAHPVLYILIYLIFTATLKSI